MLSPLCFEKHREISVNNLVPQREACSLECMRQGRGGRSVGVCFCLGLCFRLSCGFSLKLSAAVTALNSESNFARAYSEGVNRTKYWEVGNFAVMIDV